MTPQEINKYLAEKIGWKAWKASDVHGTILMWRHEDNEMHKLGICIPQHEADFSHDIGACLKWLVPYAEKQGVIFWLFKVPNEEYRAVFEGGVSYFSSKNKDPAKAFCAAMVEYFKGSKGE